MSKTNYNKISTEKANAEVEEVVVEEATAEVETPVAEETIAEVEAPIEETPEGADPGVAMVIGVVSNCVRLNVREKPNIKSDIVCVISKDSEVVIDEDKSTNAFYYVYVSNIVEKTHVEGYCMKKYISIKQ